MKTNFFKGLVCTLVMLFPFILPAQDITVSVGEENTVYEEHMFFRVLGKRDDKLIVLGGGFENGRDRADLLTYDCNNNYKLIKKVEADFERKSLTAPAKDTYTLSFADIIGDKIYIIMGMKSKEKKVYHAAAFDFDLNIAKEWSVLFEEEFDENATSGYTSVIDELAFFSTSDSLLVLAGVSFENNDFKIVYDAFDLDFGAVDKEWKFKDLKPEVEEKQHVVLDQAADYRGKVLNVYLTNTKKAFNKKPSGISLYYSLYSTSLLVKHADGKVLDFPPNIYLKEVSTRYDSAENSFIVTGFYNDFTKKKKKPCGVFYIKYDVDEEKVVKQTFTETDEAFTKSFKKSKFRKKNKENEWGYAFAISNPAHGDVLVSRSFYKSNIIYAVRNYDVWGKNFTASFGDIMLFRFAEDGTLRGHTFIPKYSIKTSPYSHIGREDSYIALIGEDNKMFVVFTDNRDNYTNGVFNNQKNKDNVKERTCLAYTTINQNGQIERKVLMSEVVRETGVNLYPGSLLKISDSEYVWMGYRAGISRVVTIKVK